MCSNSNNNPPQIFPKLCWLIILLLITVVDVTVVRAEETAKPPPPPSSSHRSRSGTAARPPPALIVFGDSIVDPGNNNAIAATTVHCNFPPYGQDFVGRRATGRFSNGVIPSDIIASKLGIKQYVPAYLGAELTADDLLTGVSFASGGSGFDPLTSELVVNLIISKSLYMVVTGTDDLANTYFNTPYRRAEYDLHSYIKFVVESAARFLQELYRMGARKIGVAGVPPIGCLPSQRTNAGGIERECVTLYNQAAVAYNSELSKEVQKLNATLAGSRIVFIDMYTPLLDMIQHPSAYGFTEIARGCCGTGIFEVTLTCNEITARACPDVSKHIFWDTYHPTERAYTILIGKLLRKYKPFLNISQKKNHS